MSIFKPSRPLQSEPIIITDQVIACEVGGGFTVGWLDDAPSFPSRQFALAVANVGRHRREAKHQRQEQS